VEDTSNENVWVGGTLIPRHLDIYYALLRAC